MPRRPTILAAAVVSTFAVVVGALRSASTQDAAKAGLDDSHAAALARISPESLAGHVAFLASDLLEGRDTPSHGLDVAAEYIAAQFRRAGLVPAGNDGYFQIAEWQILEPDPASLRCAIKTGDRVFHLDARRITLTDRGAIALDDVPIVRLKATDAEALAALTPEQVEGKAVACALPIPPGRADPETPAPRLSVARLQSPIVDRLKECKAAAVVWLDPTSPRGAGLPKGRLIDPQAAARAAPRPAETARPVSLTVHDPAAREAIEQSETASLTFHVAAPTPLPVTLRNVAGLLRGSDPQLSDTYILVTAHYDHIGVGGNLGEGDHIFNGANDDASGTAMVMQLAESLATMQPRPRRSILFLTFFGEEKGLLGSRFYARHPLVPLERTVAMLNLEQVGRTDDTEGAQIDRASLTGFDFSDVGPLLARAARAAGVEIFKHPRNSDSFFGRSDNQALADRGVPAHTLCTTYIFPDYHRVGDHWEKIDYDNMARVGRAAALGLLALAEASSPPRWNEDNPKTARYVKAWRALVGHDAAPPADAAAVAPPPTGDPSK